MAVKKRKVARRSSGSAPQVHTYQRVLMYTVIGFMVVLSVSVIMLLQQYN